MLKKILYSEVLKIFLRFFFSFLYSKEFLTGYYFDQKRLGWYWCFRSIPSRLWGDNRKIKFPVHPRTILSNDKNIAFDVDNLNIFQTPGCYWQNHNAKIHIGKGSFVAPNVGFITTNHNLYDLKKHEDGKDVVIGKDCWIGMNSVILPGVILGDHTIVGAGSVVTKSFLEGNIVIAGNPAKIIKNLIVEIEK